MVNCRKRSSCSNQQCIWNTLKYSFWYASYIKLCLVFTTHPEPGVPNFRIFWLFLVLHLQVWPVSFYPIHRDTITYLLVYVDDILITGNDSTTIQLWLNNYIILLLLKTWALSISSLVFKWPTYLIVVSIYPKGNILLIFSVESKCNMLKVSVLPWSVAAKWLHTVVILFDVHMYRSVMGTLRYATFTRLRISYSVNRVCQFI